MEPDRTRWAQLAVEELLEELELMFGQFPVIFDDPFFVAGVAALVEPDVDDVLVVDGVLVAALASFTRTTAVGLARISVFAAVRCVAGAAPAEVTPRPITVPTAAALMAIAVSALRLLWVILALFCSL